MNWITSEIVSMTKNERRSNTLSESNIRTCLKYKASASGMEMRAAYCVSLLHARSMATCKRSANYRNTRSKINVASIS